MYTPKSLLGGKSAPHFWNGTLFFFLKEKEPKRSKNPNGLSLCAAENYRCDRSPKRFHFAKPHRNHAVG